MTTFKPSIKTEWFPLFIIAISGIAGAYIQFNAPDQMPIHWDISGNVDGWSGRTFAAWFMPAIMVGMYGLFSFLPHLGPKRKQYHSFARAYASIRNLIMAFMLAIYLITAWAGFGHAVDIARILPIGIGVLFIILGYYIGSVKQNWFMGVRNPWTLSNEEVWTKANKLMAPVMAAGGILIALTAVINLSWLKITLFIIAIAGIVIIPNLYSYLLFRQKTK